jgi:uncharacterized delta-60 repeat protein
VQIQPGDQKIVAAGSITNPDNSTETRMAIARNDALGNPDSTYGSGGFSILPLSGVSAPALGSSNESGWDLVLQPDGKAVVSGFNEVNSSFAVARFNTSGTLDSGFGNGGWTSLNARADSFNPAEGVGLQSTGKVVVAGTSLGIDPNPAEVARFTTGGVIDSGKGGFGQVVQGKATGYTLNTFGMPNNVFHDLAVQQDDKLVAVGLARPDGGQNRLAVARYTASGTLDTTFNGNGYSLFVVPGISESFGWAVALQSNGKIVVTGFSTGTDGAYDMFVARYNSNGTLDPSFGGGTGYVRLDDGAAPQSEEFGRDVAIQPDGKIVVGGWTRITGNPGKVLVARFNVDGTLDGMFGMGGVKFGTQAAGLSSSASGLALQSDGSIIVAGGLSGADGIGHPLLMRFYGDAPLQALGGPAPAGAAVETLTAEQLQPLLTEAVARWQAAGLDTSVLSDLNIRIADLGGTTLGLASGNTIYLDDNAANYGWFVDPTPGDDIEFTTPGNQGEKHRMDLLTVLEHEFGHLLGLGHSTSGVMQDSLATGVRRMPSDAATVDHFFAAGHDQQSLDGDILTALVS